MRDFTTRMMMAAATLVAAAGAASAQTMKAEIPFPFQAGKGMMAAGTYRVESIRQPDGWQMFLLRPADGRAPVLLAPVASGDVNKAWRAKGVPVLAFECTATRCALSHIWTGQDARAAYAFPQRKMGKDEAVHVAQIEMRTEKSE